MNNKTFNHLKRVIAVILSAAMTVSMLSACSTRAAGPRQSSTPQTSNDRGTSVSQQAYDENTITSQAAYDESTNTSHTAAEEGTETLSAKGTLTSDDVTFDDLTAGCSGCQEVAKYTRALSKAFQHLRETDSDMEAYLAKIDEIQQKIYDLMQHDCKAQKVYVENMPLNYYRYWGFYTGDWQGAGPVGYGSFIGESINLACVIGQNHIYQYEGDWQGAVPYGNGKFHSEFTMQDADGKTVRINIQDYVGGMKMGVKDGEGTQYENNNERGDITVRYYDTGYYQNGHLQGTVDFAEYDGEGTLQKSGTAKDSYIGNPAILAVDELTYDRDSSIRTAEEVAGAVLGILAIAGGVFLANELGGSTYSPSSADQAQRDLSQQLNSDSKNANDLDEQIFREQEEAKRQADEFYWEQYDENDRRYLESSQKAADDYYWSQKENGY